eukprot:1328353-Rhodomonas_salina.4
MSVPGLGVPSSPSSPGPPFTFASFSGVASGSCACDTSTPSIAIDAAIDDARSCCKLASAASGVRGKSVLASRLADLPRATFCVTLAISDSSEIGPASKSSGGGGGAIFGGVYLLRLGLLLLLLVRPAPCSELALVSSKLWPGPRGAETAAGFEATLRERLGGRGWELAALGCWC